MIVHIGRRERLARLVAAVLAIAAALPTASCASPCGYGVQWTAISPDGLKKAVIFVRGCGAIVRDLTELSILSASSSAPREEGNILRIGDDPANPIRRSEAGIEIRVKWKSATELSVSYPRLAKVFKRESRAGGVRVEYDSF